MGGGTWTTASATSFVTTKYAACGVRNLDDLAKLNVNQIYDSRKLDPMLNPKGVIRECRDTKEHPNTIPIILALDVTGSMGRATKACATKLDEIITSLYGKVEDVEFLMMGIGDLAYDHAPIQATQFESDVRIIDQTTKIWFEGGGGGNEFESYTAAWYFGLYHTDLDCWKRGKRGLIITLGDEPLNPYLPGRNLYKTLDGQRSSDFADIETTDLYKAASEKFDIYHIAVKDNESSFRHYEDKIRDSWGKLLGQKCLYAYSNDLPEVIEMIVNEHTGASEITPKENPSEGISW